MTSKQFTATPLNQYAESSSHETTEPFHIQSKADDIPRFNSRPVCVPNEVASELAPAQKPVKKNLLQYTSTQGAAVHAKELAMYKRSILSNNIHNPTQKLKANTLLNQPLPTETALKPWRDTSEFDKLATAAVSLYWIGEKEDWELKSFTLIFNEKLSSDMDDGTAEAFEYARDQITRAIKKALGSEAQFLYGIEKAPATLAAEGSRRRWHVHGLIVARKGFSNPGKTPLRKALQGIKGEADTDLMFKTPGEKIERSARASAMSWSFYASKNGLSVQINPALSDSYNLPTGKQTFISAVLKREAKRWHEGKMKGLTERTLRETGPAGLYSPPAATPCTDPN